MCIMHSLKLRLGTDSIGYLPQDLISVRSQTFPHVWHFLLHQFHQQRRYLLQEVVIHVIIPCRYEYSIVRLEDEVVTDVVYDESLGHVTAKQRQILDEEGSILRSVLTVESVLDVIVNVYLVYDLVCVVLQSCCEDDYLVELSHQLYEVHASWPH